MSTGRRHLEALKRRAEHLEGRCHASLGRDGTVLTYDAAELAALRWAIKVCEGRRDHARRLQEKLERLRFAVRGLLETWRAQGSYVPRQPFCELDGAIHRCRAAALIEQQLADGDSAHGEGESPP